MLTDAAMEVRIEFQRLKRLEQQVVSAASRLVEYREALEKFRLAVINHITADFPAQFENFDYAKMQLAEAILGFHNSVNALKEVEAIEPSLCNHKETVIKDEP